MSTFNTLIYAELLSNIRQISIIAALDKPSEADTKVRLLASGHQIELRHDGEITTLNLPGHATPNHQLQQPAIGNKEISWRLPLGSSRERVAADGVQSNNAPWPATSLKENTEFLCRNCGAPIVRRGTIKTWRDLPSENWAEMMDFWHCHKPSDHVPNHSKGQPEHIDEETNAANRGYGANTKFTAQSELGFVDVTTILFADSDCPGIKAQNLSDTLPQGQELACTTCRTYVGYFDRQAGGSRLYKWRLSIPPPLNGHPSSHCQPSISSTVSAQVLSIMSAQCCSRLVISPKDGFHTSQYAPQTSSPDQTFARISTGLPSLMPSASVSSPSFVTSTRSDNSTSTPTQPSSSHPTHLSVWILTPALRYSSTNQEAQLTSSPSSNEACKPQFGTLAMKVFWKPVSVAAAMALVQSPGVEEMSLPMEAIREIESTLQRSARFLPPSARKFQDWDVGLLDRFEVRDGD